MANPIPDSDSDNEVHNTPDSENYSPTMPEKNDTMDEDDVSETPRRVTRRTGKRALVASPTHEQPPAQRKKLVHPVSHSSVYLNPDK
jgi:hypothetical protein